MCPFQDMSSLPLFRISLVMSCCFQRVPYPVLCLFVTTSRLNCGGIASGKRLSISYNQIPIVSEFDLLFTYNHLSDIFHPLLSSRLWIGIRNITSLSRVTCTTPQHHRPCTTICKMLVLQLIIINQYVSLENKTILLVSFENNLRIFIQASVKLTSAFQSVKIHSLSCRLEFLCGPFSFLRCFRFRVQVQIQPLLKKKRFGCFGFGFNYSVETIKN